MTIHVPIDQAQAELARLVEAAMRGEDVFLEVGNGGRVRLLPVLPLRDLSDEERREVAESRRSAFGMYKEAFEGRDTSLEALKSDHVDIDERFELTHPRAAPISAAR